MKNQEQPRYQPGDRLAIGLNANGSPPDIETVHGSVRNLHASSSLNNEAGENNAEQEPQQPEQQLPVVVQEAPTGIFADLAQMVTNPFALPGPQIE